jgi:uncharacterized protein (TIGR02118 family)
MIKVNAFYPNKPGCRFDMTYYTKKHIPMVRDRLGAACTGIAVDQGVSGEASGSPAPFVAVVHLFFPSLQVFQDAFAEHGEVIMRDVPNYTNLEPVIQVSDVVINARGNETGELHVH